MKEQQFSIWSMFVRKRQNQASQQNVVGINASILVPKHICGFG